MIWRLANNQVLLNVARFVLAGIFILSAIGKLVEPREEFIALVKSFAVIPDGLAVVYATLLPWVELLTGVMLVLGFYVRWAAVLSLLMLLSFVIAIIFVLIRDGNLDDCGCFGIFSIQELPEALIARDGFFMVLSALLLFGATPKFSIDKKFN